MKRLLLLLSLVIAACASTPQREQGLVARALDAMGGADALASRKSIVIKGTRKEWEPEQSVVAGGEMRFANEASFEFIADIAGRSTRVDWVKNFSYPATRTFKFSEIVTPDAGYIAGIDSNGRNKQSLNSNPPGYAMSSLRLATFQREQLRTSPQLLLQMRANPQNVSASPDVAIGGVLYPAVNYKAGNVTFTVMFDPQNGLPVRIRTLDWDNIHGDSTYDVVLSDWRSAGEATGLIAGARRYELNGRMISEVKVTEVKANQPVAASAFAIPAAARATAAKPATGGNVPYQWVIRRQIIGTYLDSENPSFDTQAFPAMALTELAPGVQQTVNSAGNSLIVEMKDHLIVFDAPASDWQSKWTIAAAKAKYPGKPIKYLVLTHHHMDHAGGLRSYAAEGATIIVGKGNGGHFRKALTAKSTLNPDLATRDFSLTQVVEVADKHMLSDGKREVSMHVIDNPHCMGMMIGYVSDAKIGWVADLWSPGRDPLPEKINPALTAVVSGVKRAGISPVKFAGGHGTVGDYAPLVALASK